MKAPPVWLSLEMVLAIQDEQLASFGGGSGLRDRGLLESAVSRPRQKFHYNDDVSIFELAAAYGFGICRNHPFVDGNKRTSLLCIVAFLALNGYLFRPAQVDEVRHVLALAAGELEEEVLAGWIEANAVLQQSAPR